jgi:putative inorganic carbon (hco3(-)) transporter
MSYLIDTVKKHLGVITIALLYIIVNTFLTYRGILYLNLLPVVLIIVLIAISRLDIIFFIIILCIPLSVQLIDFMPGSSIDFAIPTEPLLFGILLIIIYKLVLNNSLDKKVLNHPVTYAIIFYLAWILITSLTSSMPLVSIKFLLVRIWFLTSFYLLAIYIFKTTTRITTFIICYSSTMAIVVIYTISRHLGYGIFDKEAAHFVMTPFFRDHTSYGAVLAILFFALGSVLLKRNLRLIHRLLFLLLFVIIIIGTILSYTRAAWVSIVFSFGILIISLVRIKFTYVALVGTLVILFFVSQKDSIIYKMEKNKQESSANLTEHLQSISNIKSDNSNMERLNRWSCAIRMFKERPLFGWGPGTYMFKYAPYQLAKNKTYISTDFGDLGNAHSEYIGPLAETGFIGTLSFIIIAITSLVTGYRVYRRMDDKSLKVITLGLILGLITYLVHGTLNNFLDMDKVASLFWGSIAVFVSLDIFYLPKIKQQSGMTDSVNKLKQ